jgi:hypothetical protein
MELAGFLSREIYFLSLGKTLKHDQIDQFDQPKRLRTPTR